MTPPQLSSGGRLAQNVVHFARVLRSAGLPLGTDRVQLAQQALMTAGLESRAEFRAVLRACLLDRIEHAELFDQAFALFWKDPDLLGRLHALRQPPDQPQTGAATGPKDNRRLGEALLPNPPQAQTTEPPPREDTGWGAALTVSAREVLRQADFETMTAEEWRQARSLIGRLRPVVETLPTRRYAPSATCDRMDWRATMRLSARRGGEWVPPRWRAPRQQAAPLVVLADISGSMSRYSRILLHLAHTLRQAQGQRAAAGATVESFVFGTRLTRITRLVARRDPDIAVAEVVRSVQDWSGGTRITASLHEFNRRWARRVMPGNATVLLISDGLERADPSALHELGREMAHLRRHCRRLVWLNPLLRYQDFQPRAGGIKAMLPHVDHFIPAHNLDSLEGLIRLLVQPAAAGASPPGGRRSPSTTTSRPPQSSLPSVSKKVLLAS
jgi:uncharacterized protein with von Willebrand factor type A (vWA) domain